MCVNLFLLSYEQFHEEGARNINEFLYVTSKVIIKKPGILGARGIVNLYGHSAYRFSQDDQSISQ